VEIGGICVGLSHAVPFVASHLLEGEPFRKRLPKSHSVHALYHPQPKTFLRSQFGLSLQFVRLVGFPETLRIEPNPFLSNPAYRAPGSRQRPHGGVGDSRPRTE
jgi:hypothetical protein